MLTDFEIIDAVRELNAESDADGTLDSSPFEVRFDGSSCAITFLGNRIWLGDEDERNYDEKTDTYEPIINCLRRWSAEEIGKLTKITAVWAEPDMQLVETAAAFAIAAHAGQFRRNGTTPYIRHPEAVALALEGESSELIATAWLHDVLEDTKVRVADLRLANIPESVIKAVVLLTREDEQPYVDYLAQVEQNEITRRVKLADINHNLSDHPTEKQSAKYHEGIRILARPSSLGFVVDEGRSEPI